MKIYEIILIGIGVAMDAFAVSICKGLSMKTKNIKKSIIISSYFGIFQTIMPILGYYLGATFKNVVVEIDHWIAFILLSIIGGNMIKESFNKTSDQFNDNIDAKTMLLLSIATSIDALAIGVTFALLKINIFSSSGIMGIITFILSYIGVETGKRFGKKLNKGAELIGGFILIIIGLKILIEHLGLLQKI